VLTVPVVGLSHGACVCRLWVVALICLAALISDESALEVRYRDDALYKSTAFTFKAVLKQLILFMQAYMFYRCFFLFFVCFFPSTKTMRQPFSGMAERIFMKLLPNDTGKHGV